MERQDFLADDVQALRLEFGLDQRLDFLDHHHLIDHRGQFAALFERHRAGEAKFQHRGVREGFLDVHVSRAGSDEADAPVGTFLNEVQRRNFSLGAQLDVALEHQRNTLAGIARHHDETPRFLLEARTVVGDTFADSDQRFHMIDPRRHAQDDRHLELLGKLERLLGHRIGLLRIGRLEHGDVRKAPPVARILLVLRRREANVVGNGDHQTTDDAGQGQRHQRIGSHIHPDMLHAAERTGTGVGAADGNLQRHLFIDRPLGVEIGIGGNHLQHFGGRRARIGRGNLDAGLPDCPGDRFVTR